MIDDMRPGPDLYIVRPRQSREGWSLESDRLSHGRLWYENEAAFSIPANTSADQPRFRQPWLSSVSLGRLARPMDSGSQLARRRGL